MVLWCMVSPSVYPVTFYPYMYYTCTNDLVKFINLAGAFMLNYVFAIATLLLFGYRTAEKCFYNV